MGIAKLTASRSTCRVQVGAVAIKDNRIIMSAYNGSPPGMAHCLDVGCLIENNHCVRTIHAEMNIITQCAKEGISLKNATIYCTHQPCNRCQRHLIAAEVKLVYYNKEYSDDFLDGELEKQFLTHKMGEE